MAVHPTFKYQHHAKHLLHLHEDYLKKKIELFITEKLSSIHKSTEELPGTHNKVQPSSDQPIYVPPTHDPSPTPIN